MNLKGMLGGFSQVKGRKGELAEPLRISALGGQQKKEKKYLQCSLVFLGIYCCKGVLNAHLSFKMHTCPVSGSVFSRSVEYNPLVLRDGSFTCCNKDGKRGL